jgi:uncharacterized membrane protein YGL010W
MRDIFRRELASYADSHRNRVNGVMHIIGNPILFIAVVLPLCLVPVTLFGLHTSAAPLLVVPALALWTAWDVAIGFAIIITAVPLLWLAAAIADHVSIGWMWTIAIGLFVLGWAMQIVGHQVFEGKRPSLLDNPLHMLISPMYVFARLFIALGLRPDLAAIVRRSPEPDAYGSPRCPRGGPADVGQHP